MLDIFSGDYVGPKCAIVVRLGYFGAGRNKAEEGGLCMWREKERVV